jgi:hypothetical protein
MSKKSTLEWLRTASGELSTQTLARLEKDLAWYRAMPASRRSAVGLVAQAGINSFIKWFERPKSTASIAQDVFGAAPRELLRSVSLQQTLQLIKLTVEVVEEQIREGREDLHEAILLYSRELAFAAADVYARAAEARGLWDQRLEALVVDSILAGEYDQELPSRIAALGWSGNGDVAVLVGTPPRHTDPDQIRRVAKNLNVDVLIGVQGSRMVVVIGHRLHQEGQPVIAPVPFFQIAKEMDEFFGPGALVLGPTVETILEAVDSAKAALSGFAVSPALRVIPRPVLADDMLPERAIAGDALARQVLVTEVYEPLRDHPLDLLQTVWTYFETGHSLEATSKELFIHANTVRYRLKKVTDTLDYDPSEPRDSLILHAAIVLGRISEKPQGRKKLDEMPAELETEA